MVSSPLLVFRGARVEVSCLDSALCSKAIANGTIASYLSNKIVQRYEQKISAFFISRMLSAEAWASIDVVAGRTIRRKTSSSMAQISLHLYRQTDKRKTLSGTVVSAGCEIEERMAVSTKVKKGAAGLS